MQLDLGCALLGHGTEEATLCFHPFPLPSLLLQAAELPLTPSSGVQEGVISVEVVNFSCKTSLSSLPCDGKWILANTAQVYFKGWNSKVQESVVQKNEKQIPTVLFICLIGHEAFYSIFKNSCGYAYVLQVIKSGVCCG